MAHIFLYMLMSLGGLYLAASAHVLIAKLFPIPWLLDEIFANSISAFILLLCRIGISYMVFMIFVLVAAMMWMLWDMLFSYQIAGTNGDTKEVERGLDRRRNIVLKIINILSLGLVNIKLADISGFSDFSATPKSK